ncbi:hypothetical protein ABW17_14130 [Mycobacterium nebraskense]|uniref:hypothetical protein n=1 Tax=Mycobacterium nebraskense TaxID=244292 RepID=UPI0006420A13|nr:hypothetical protein [Mycobacterium nebraskense]KLO41375.1 hypothetical protein ABW17_14130 [Mycobacterium nebraskense]
MKFVYQESIQVSKDQLPGLKIDENGMVNGDVFALAKPQSLIALAEWCDVWADELTDGTPAHIELRELATLEVWARAFRQMADAA